MRRQSPKVRNPHAGRNGSESSTPKTFFARTATCAVSSASMHELQRGFKPDGVRVERAQYHSIKKDSLNITGPLIFWFKVWLLTLRGLLGFLNLWCSGFRGSSLRASRACAGGEWRLPLHGPQRLSGQDQRRAHRVRGGAAEFGVRAQLALGKP